MAQPIPTHKVRLYMKWDMVHRGVRLPSERKYAYTLYFIVCISLVCAPYPRGEGVQVGGMCVCVYV